MRDYQGLARGDITLFFQAAPHVKLRELQAIFGTDSPRKIIVCVAQQHAGCRGMLRCHLMCGARKKERMETTLKSRCYDQNVAEPTLVKGRRRNPFVASCIFSFFLCVFDLWPSLRAVGRFFPTHTHTCFPRNNADDDELLLISVGECSVAATEEGGPRDQPTGHLSQHKQRR